MHLRLLDTFRFDMPPCEIVLQHAQKTFLGIVAALCTASGVRGAQRRGPLADAPKDEVRVGHEICYALQHTPRLQHERREGDFV